ncbi:MAG: hypothetical protein HFF50_02825 [Lawsonibacter sp.]|nr:hypothetical protein [Lawsonibacter sp.]
MKKLVRYGGALLLTAVLTVGSAFSAGAFSYPAAYDTVYSAWEDARSSGDTGSLLDLSQQLYAMLSQYERSVEVCSLETVCAQASWCAELEGDLEQAVTWLERQEELVRWLHENGEDRQDELEAIVARLAHLTAAVHPAVYALAAGEESTRSSSLTQGTWIGSGVHSGQSGDPGVLASIPFLDGNSVEYWLSQFKSSSARFSQAAAPGGLIQLAWNFEPEGTDGVNKVLEPSADSYISEGLRAMASLNCTVLLRIGGGMNAWPSCDSGRYIQAFQKIAREADRYPNVQTLFAPDAAGGEFTAFYPGDPYVDWVGAITHQAPSARSQDNEPAAYFYGYAEYQEDARQGTGLYSRNPVAPLWPILQFALDHDKPIVVAGCSFAAAPGEAQSTFAAEQLTRFYAYINMICPQIKAVFYEDIPQGEPGALTDDAGLDAAYRAAVSGNGTYFVNGNASPRRWDTLEQINLECNSSTKLRLAVYASLPGTAPITVSYWLDGSIVYTPSAAPYYFDLDAQDLLPGRHTLWATVSSGQFFQSTPTYSLYISDTGLVMGEEGAGEFQIASASDWAQGQLMNAYSRGLIPPRTQSDLQAPITRLQFAELAANLIERTTGETIPPAKNTFSDTDDEAVCKVVAAGVASGREEGIFAPDDRITRQEICVMLRHVIQYVDKTQGTFSLDNTSTQLDPQYLDGGSVADWALEAVALLTNNGLMSGRENGRVAPMENATVEEAILLALALYSRF